jgi:[ribosomal protein S5]-alanine N-acetyltransferase
MLKHTGTIQMETERLTLRKFVYDDIPNMLKNWISNPSVQNEYGEPEYKTATEVYELLSKWIAKYKNNDFYRWAVILKQNNENIGQIAFCRVYTEIETAEIEYCISENYWGKGYATEALNAVIDFSFRVPKFYKLEAFHRIANSRSGRVLRKTVMKETQTVRRFEVENTKPDDDVCYSIISDDYFTIQE